MTGETGSVRKKPGFAAVEGGLWLEAFVTYIQGLRISRERSVCYEGPSQRQANLRKLQSRPPTWRGLCHLQQQSSP